MATVRTKGGEEHVNLDSPMESVRGVNAFLLNYHLIQEDARMKGDVNALVMVMDFKNVMENISLTDRQKEAFDLVFVSGYNQREAGETMGVSQQAVQQLIRAVTSRIAEAYRNSGGKGDVK